MPSAREHALYDIRRKRAGVATVVVLVATVAGVFATERMELLALVATAMFAWGAFPAWVGVAPEYPAPRAWDSIRQHAFTIALPVIGVSLFNMVLAKGDPRFLSSVPVGLLGALVYGSYRWRYIIAAVARMRGAEDDMPLIARLWRHYLGYVAGLTAGLLALAIGRNYAADFEWLLPSTLFLSGFLIVKPLVDFVFPQPPLSAERLSGAAAQLAAMSVVWFGLPWGALLTCLLASVAVGRRISVEQALAVDAMTLVYVAVSSVVVFTAIAVVAFVLELFDSGR